VNAQELAKRIDKKFNITEWPESNVEDFASKLSSLIYYFRNSIAHSKELDRHIEKIEESPNLISDFIKLTNNSVQDKMIQWV
jgi:hypothetical protein